MNFKTAQIKASYTPRTTQVLQSSELRLFKERLLNREYEKILLSGVLIDKFSEGIYLFVDEDVVHWLEAYVDLERLLLMQERYEHNACLNDGLLTIRAEAIAEKVEVQFRYCPGLNVANLITYAENINADEYIWWWRSIAYEIQNLTLSQ